MKMKLAAGVFCALACMPMVAEAAPKSNTMHRWEVTSKDTGGTLLFSDSPEYVDRPGILLSVLCAPSQKDSIIRVIFKYTTTIGIREKLLKRYILDRSEDIVSAEGVYVRRKEVSGYGVSRSKYEFDDLRKIADAREISIRDARNLVEEKHV